MKIYGQPFLGAISYPVELLREPDKALIERNEVQFADLWRPDVVHEGKPGSDSAAYHSVALRGVQFPDGAEVTIDVLDAQSAERVVALFTDLHEAERSLLAALKEESHENRSALIERVVSLGRRWASLTRPVPCTVEEENGQAAVGAKVHNGRDRAQVVLRQDDAGAETVFWTLYERAFDGTSQAHIDVIDMEDALIVDMAREQLRALRTFSDFAADLSLPRYEETDVAPIGWPSLRDAGASEVLRALAARGLDFDPGEENLADVLSSLRDQDGRLRMGRRAAHRLAWEIGRAGNGETLTMEDLRQMAVPYMRMVAARGRAGDPMNDRGPVSCTESSFEVGGSSEFSARVRFNRGFHDGTADGERCRQPEWNPEAHHDPVYVAGYYGGKDAYRRHGVRPQTSDEAWTIQTQGEWSGQIRSFIVLTEGAGDEMELKGASIPEDQLALLLSQSGVIYARNQDGAMVELSTDMDFESPVAREVEMTSAGPKYLAAGVATIPLEMSEDEAPEGMKP